MRLFRKLAVPATVGIFAFAPGAAQADTGPNYGILNGNEVNVPITAVVNITGNTINVLNSGLL